MCIIAIIMASLRHFLKHVRQLPGAIVLVRHLMPTSENTADLTDSFNRERGNFDHRPWVFIYRKPS